MLIINLQLNLTPIYIYIDMEKKVSWHYASNSGEVTRKLDSCFTRLTVCLVVRNVLQEIEIDCGLIYFYSARMIKVDFNYVSGITQDCEIQWSVVLIDIDSPDRWGDCPGHCAWTWSLEREKYFI